MNRFVKTAIATLSLAGMTATTAFAGADHGAEATKARLGGWLKDAAQAVDSVMTYPVMAQRRGAEGEASFRVTIDRSGDVVTHEALPSNADIQIRAAARRVLEKADFPVLPASYGKGELSFQLNLTYAMAGSAHEARALERATEVRSERIASRRGPVSASLQILPSAE
ncbi:energy transducer TonB [Yunchengibacter salinarum]|uniref:energy transducer TonB n=1 Tax=Yunchengibacter salinarum TaxID=3133399 RepID=UPI0035B63B11